MSKKINILMLDNMMNANSELLSDDCVKKYLELEDIKSQELTTVQRLCQYLKTTSLLYQFYENYYLNYKIPQIGKEFDLLRIGRESVVNIELKSGQVSDEEVLTQLKRNYYYLSFLGRTIHCYTFMTDGTQDILFYFDVITQELQRISDKNHILYNLYHLNDMEDTTIDSLFVPSNYLISPFNTTDKFIENQYFLTQHQEDIKKEIIKEITSNSQNKIFSISGTAGTGKTLLTYDIAKELRNIGKSVTIIHCAQFNNGITKLRTQYQWDIRTIKNYSISPLSNILIVDEAQRLEKSQFEALVSIGNKTIIFSHDVNQRLNRTNQAQEVVALIKLNAHKSPYELSHKIRHNKSLASFLKKFYDLTKITTDTLVCKDYENIFFYYAKNLNDAQTYVSFLMTNGWEYIYLTNSRYNQESLSHLKFSDNSAHQAIGQEYDNVVVTIDQNFFYKENKKLAYRYGCYYSPLETLFQAITRTRKKIMFVIINNKEVYENCIRIIEKR